MVGWSVIISQKKAQKLHVNAPFRALSTGVNEHVRGEGQAGTEGGKISIIKMFSHLECEESTQDKRSRKRME